MCIEELKHSILVQNEGDYESPKSEPGIQNYNIHHVKTFKTNCKNQEDGQLLTTNRKFSKTLKSMKYNQSAKEPNSAHTRLQLFDSCEILKSMHTQRKDYSKTIKDLSEMIIEEVKDEHPASP